MSKEGSSHRSGHGDKVKRRLRRQRRVESNSVRLANYRAAVLFERRILVGITLFSYLAALVCFSLIHC